jgi:hypothetical protein
MFVPEGHHLLVAAMVDRGFVEGVEDPAVVAVAVEAVF